MAIAAPGKPRMVRRMVLLAAGALLGGWIALPPALVWSSIRRKPSRPVLGAGWRLAAEDVRFRSADGTRLSGWLVRPSDGRVRSVVVLLHGIDGDRSMMLPAADILQRHGYASLLFDFRGRGESGGAGSTLGYREVEDALAAVRFALSRRELRGVPMAALGASLGGSVAIMAAAREPRVRAVVAEAPFSRLDRAIDNHFRGGLGIAGPLLSMPTRRLGEQVLGFDTCAVAPERDIARVAPRPAMLIHDGADRVVPPTEGRRLLASARGCARLWVAPGAPHVGAQWTVPEEYERHVVAFLDKALRADVTQVPGASASKGQP